jgi:uncharacterized protein YqgC (DUF456 family)
MDTWLVAIAVAVMVVGLVGVVVPVLPGLLLVWVATVATTLLAGTDAVGWLMAAWLTLLFAMGTAATVWLPARQGRRGGVPTSSLLGALAGAIVGFAIVPVVGFVLGAVAGLALAERRRLATWQDTWGSVGRVLRAYGVGVVVELLVGVSMIVSWALALLLR